MVEGEKNTILLCVSMILLIVFVIEILIFSRNNTHAFQCLTSGNPVCHSDWSCQDEQGNTDNTLHSKYTKLIKNKDGFLGPIQTSGDHNNSAISTTNPYYGCKDPSYNGGQYKSIPDLTGGQDYKYGTTPLSSYTGSTVPGGLPSDSLFCVPTTGGSPYPSFLPNTAT